MADDTYFFGNADPRLDFIYISFYKKGRNPCQFFFQVCLYVCTVPSCMRNVLYEVPFQSFLISDAWFARYGSLQLRNAL